MHIIIIKVEYIHVSIMLLTHLTFFAAPTSPLSEEVASSI